MSSKEDTAVVYEENFRKQALDNVAGRYYNSIMDYNSLTQLLAHSGKSVDPTKYAWERMDYAADKIRAHDTERVRVGHVDVGYLPYDWESRNIALGYGGSFKEIVEAIEYTDGSILLCATCGEFAGTFASHDDIVIRFFRLTPLPTPTPAAKGKKGKRK